VLPIYPRFTLLAWYTVCRVLEGEFNEEAQWREANPLLPEPYTVTGHAMCRVLKGEINEEAQWREASPCGQDSFIFGRSLSVGHVLSMRNQWRVAVNIYVLLLSKSALSSFQKNNGYENCGVSHIPISHAKSMKSRGEERRDTTVWIGIVVLPKRKLISTLCVVTHTTE